MSWIEKIQQNLTITCGDGRKFTPLYVYTQKSVEYNISEFEFVDIEGALVKRRKPKARRFELEIIFDGENNLDTSAAFEESAKDPRHWVMFHPLYGDLNVQPISLGFDNRVINITRITGTVIETIVEGAPRSTADAVDTITDLSEVVSDSIATSYAENIVPNATDINEMTAANGSLYNDGKVLAKEGDEADGYFNAFNDANSAILNATSEPLAAMNKIQAVIAAPALFAETIDARFRQFETQIDKFRAQLSGITTKSSKFLYQSNTGGVINAMVLAAAYPLPGDYAKKQFILNIIDKLLSVYNQFIVDLDTLQTDNGGSPDSFVPDFTSINQLTSLVNFAVTNLFSISLGAKQERFIYLESDSNAIVLTHRFYGLVADDSTIDDFIAQNEIGLTEILNIRKGRKIIYFVD